ncbi:MAG: A24 family peptidase [Clostridiales bacterium]|nr:A24 family peptidase [Clostridiales bacterium]
MSIVAVILCCVVLACLVAIAWADHKTMEIPDRFNIAIAACGVAAIFAMPGIGLSDRLIGIAVAAVPLLVTAILIDGAFGFGDVKLMAAAGLFLGWQHCLVALFVGIVIGGAYGAFLLITRKKGRADHFAFGPALCVGIGVAMFAGDDVTGWYIGV